MKNQLRIAIIALLFILIGVTGTLGLSVFADSSLPLNANNDIIFVSYQDSNCEIYTMKADGSNQTRLTYTNRFLKEWPSWSPDGSKILYIGYSPEPSSHIYVMNANGTGRTQLTYDTLWDNVPCWSPDGTKIAYISHSTGNTSPRQVNVINADGTKLPGFPQYIQLYGGGVTWSPDGTKIACVDDFNFHIFDLNGTQLRDFPNNIKAYRIQWSPDGTKFLVCTYSSQENESNMIGIINIDGSGFHTITSGGSPAWSPDGRKIVFESFVNSGICAIDVDGTHETQLTNGFGICPSWKRSNNLIPLSINNFQCFKDATAQANASLDTQDYNTAPASYKIECINNGDKSSSIQLFIKPLNIIRDKIYQLTFKAKCTTDFTIPSINLMKAISPWTDYAALYSKLPITTSWRDYTVIFKANTTASDGRITFFLGAALPDGAVFHLDSAILKELDPIPAAVGELLPNPGFDTGLANWNFYSDSSAQTKGYLDAINFDTAPVSYRIESINNGDTLNSIQLFTMPISIIQNKTYQLSFKAKSTGIFAIPSIRLMKATSPWTLYANPYSGLTITNDWQSYTITFTAYTTASDGRITFFLGNALLDGATFWIDSVSLREVTL